MHDLIGNNVLAKNIITYTKAEFNKRGCKITQVISVDAGGMIPDFIKLRASMYYANSAMYLVDWLMNDIIPPPIF